MSDSTSASAVRIDKWLWAVRIYKTRALAAAACRAGHVQMGGQRVKPSRFVHANELITAKVGLITKTAKVIGLLERRVGAKLVPQYVEDLTPESEYQKLKDLAQQPSMVPFKGLGRPTKKDRRAMDRFLS